MFRCVETCFNGLRDGSVTEVPTPLRDFATELAKSSLQPSRNDPPSIDQLADRISSVMSDQQSQPVFRLSAADIRSCDKMTDTTPPKNLPDILTNFRIKVGLRAQTVNSDESYADNLAFLHLHEILQGKYLQVYNQLRLGQINWKAATPSQCPVGTQNTYDSPSTWQQLSSAFLDLVMPAHCAQDYAYDIATAAQRPRESVTEYLARFRHLLSSYTQAVDRASPNGSGDPWQAFTVCMFTNGLKPEVKATSSTQSPPTTLEEAGTRARNVEAGNHAAHTVSAVSFASGTNFNTKRKPKRVVNKKRKTPPPPQPQQSQEQPYCHYRYCHNRNTHNIEDCLDRLKVEDPAAFEAKLEEVRARREAFRQRVKVARQRAAAKRSPRQQRQPSAAQGAAPSTSTRQPTTQSSSDDNDDP